MRRYNILLIAFFIIAMDTNAKVIPIKDYLSLELYYLFDSLDKTSLSAKQQERLNHYARSLEQYFNTLTNEQVLYLSKISITKGLLEKKFSDTYKEGQVSKKDLELLNAKYNQSGNDYSSFSRWFLRSIIADFDNYKTHPFFDNSMAPGNREDKDLQEIRKRKRFHSPWVKAFLTLPPQEFDGKMNTTLFEILEVLEAGAGLLSKQAAPLQSNLKTRKFFTITASESKSTSTSTRSSQKIKGDLESLNERADNEKVEANESVSKIGLHPPSQATPNGPTWQPADKPTEVVDQEIIQEAEKEAKTLEENAKNIPNKTNQWKPQGQP